MFLKLKSATKRVLDKVLKKEPQRKLLEENRKWDMESETVTPDGFPVDFYKKLRTT